MSAIRVEGDGAVDRAQSRRVLAGQGDKHSAASRQGFGIIATSRDHVASEAQRLGDVLIRQRDAGDLLLVPNGADQTGSRCVGGVDRQGLVERNRRAASYPSSLALRRSAWARR